ncbi:hypothetical protein [Campylobacter showae]|uniref:hypothetical protein n=1 Tax=Campylobacter showae TaxID=204 RepID=UPI003C6FF34C
MNYALLAALKESASTRQGNAEAKELPPPPYDVRSCCTACRLNLTLSRRVF